MGSNTDPITLRALADEWRESARFEHEDMANMQAALTLDQCADELNAALRACAETQEQPATKCRRCGLPYLDGRVCSASGFSLLCAAAPAPEGLGQLLNKLVLSSLAMGHQRVDPPADDGDRITDADIEAIETKIHALFAAQAPLPADTLRALVDAVFYAIKCGCLFDGVSEPRKGATVDELVKWGAMRNLHTAIAALQRVTEGQS